MTRNRIRVLVVDDHEVVRAGLTALLSRTSDIGVVGTAERAEDALSVLDTLEPDVVLLDYRLPGLSGALACSEILARLPSAAVLMLTTDLDEGVLVSCLAAGARGYLLKTADGLDLVAGVKAAARGECVLAPEALDSLVRWIQESPRVEGDPACLAPNEVAALSLAARGQKNREIARTLRVTETAVKAFLQGASRKLGARGRSDAVLAGIRRGVI